MSCAVTSVPSTRCTRDWTRDQVTCSTWSQLTPGTMATGNIVTVSEFGAMLDISGVRGVVTMSNVGGAELRVGGTVSGVVMYVDVDSLVNVVEISCMPKLKGSKLPTRD